MSRPAQITDADVSLRLQANGPLTALRLAEVLRVERSTVARALARLGNAVVHLGAARRARYALRRTVRSAGGDWRIYRIDLAGRAGEWARLEALHGGFLIEWAGEPPEWAKQAVDPEGFVDGFPFFLGDMRPQGFLGRQQARRLAAALRLEEDPRRWNDDDTLVFLQAEGDGLPGDLIVGDAPLRRMLARSFASRTDDELVSEDSRAIRYPELMARASAGGLPGSSAGGEQPKFLATLRRADGAVQPVLVKFSPPMETSVGRRWADLLAAESHALTVLAEHGLANAGARVLDAGGRRFFEVVRFDRDGAQGRRGVVSLEALHAAFADGSPTEWPAAAESLERAQLIDNAGRDVVRRLHSFGELIGNSDMHFGNLSFWRDDALPFRPTPAYDMLPMAWAPNTQGEVVEREFAPPPPLPGALPVWSEAAGWAVEFWRRVSGDDRVSPDFAGRAKAAGEQVARMRAHFVP